MKPGRNLIVSFVLVLAFIIYFFILSYQNKKQAERLNNSVIHAYLVIEEITELNAIITELESQVRGYVISNNKEFIADLSTKEQSVYSYFKRIKELTADNAIQQKKLEA